MCHWLVPHRDTGGGKTPHLHLRWTQVCWDERENLREAVGPQKWLKEQQGP